MIFLNAVLVAPGFVWNAAVARLVLVVFLLVVAGFLTGYAGTLALSDRSRATAMAMIYNVGIRNISSGLVIATTYFPPAVGIPVLLYILYQQPLAATVPLLYDLAEKRRARPPGSQQGK